MARMQRTQIYLDAEMSAALGRLARKRGTTKASLIRLATRRMLDQEGLVGDDAILDIVGMGDSGETNLSVDHDAALIEHELSRRSR